MSGINDAIFQQPWIDIRPRCAPDMSVYNGLIESLRSVGSVHVREEWCPAAGATYDVNIWVKLGFYLATIWLDGKTFKALEQCEEKVIDCIKDFFQKDKHQTELNSLEFNLDDTDIKFQFVDFVMLDQINLFFKELPENLEYLNSKDIANIQSIRVLDEDQSEKYIDAFDRLSGNVEKKHLRIWKIVYNHGMDCIIYDSHTKYMIDELIP